MRRERGMSGGCGDGGHPSAESHDMDKIDKREAA
jgi:hypothetical protein